MHYFLVNGSNFPTTEKACAKIQEKLLAVYGLPSLLVTDPWLGTHDPSERKADGEMLVKLTHIDVRPQEKLSLILNTRERLMKEVILPAMGEGKVVLYHGGVIGDDQFIDKDQIPFDLVLRENMEMLQSIGGIAYPAGTVIVETAVGKLDDVVGFEEKARQLSNCMARFKQLRYGKNTKDEDLELLTKA